MIPQPHFPPHRQVGAEEGQGGPPGNKRGGCQGLPGIQTLEPQEQGPGILPELFPDMGWVEHVGSVMSFCLHYSPFTPH